MIPVEKQRIRSPEELLLFWQAKCILIAELGVSEHDAHNILRDQAMNLRMKKVDLANKILQAGPGNVRQALQWV